MATYLVEYVANNSLPDGAYSLAVSVGSISQTFTFYVFFGDFNGDHACNGTDFALFSPYMNTADTSSNWFMDGDDNGSINATDFSLLVAHFNQGATGSYSGPIVWNAASPSDLYYSSNWQVLEEDAPSTSGGSYLADQYVWGHACNGIDFALFSPYFNTAVTSSNWFMDGDNSGGMNATDYVMMTSHFNQGSHRNRRLHGWHPDR